MKYYYRVTKDGNPIPGSNFKSSKKPQGPYFREIIPQYKYCCDPDLEMPTSTGDREKFFVRLNESNAPISGSLRRVKNRLTLGNYQEVFKDNCCPVISLIIVPDTSTLDVGETQTYNVIGVYASGKTKDITESTEFTSSDTDVATITGNEATAVSGGSTTIMGDYNGVTATSSLTVNPEPAIDSVTVTPPDASILVGATQQLAATVVAEGGASEDVTWTSADEALATVDNTGLVTGVGAGTVVITATSTFDNTKKGTSNITINEAPAVNSVTVTPATASITTEDTQQLTATVDVSGGAAQTVAWTSSDEAIATVSNSGLVTPVADGEVTITATSTVDNTKSDNSVITITVPA